MTAGPEKSEAIDEELDDSDEELAQFNIKRIVWATIIGVVAIVAALAILLHAFKEPLEEAAAVFVDNLGGPGVSLGFFIPDGFTVPLPNDAFTTFAFIGGMPFWECVLWGSIGSLAGATAGFSVGRNLHHMAWFQRFMAKRGREVRLLVERYGTTTLAVAALTPIPFSIACWAVGAGGMSYGRVMLVSLLRVPRVAFYLWVLTEGMSLGSAV